MEWKEIIKFFIAGITLGSGPCLLICLPILLPYISAKGTDWKTGLRLTLIFSFSRLLAYSLLGLLAVLVYRMVNTMLGAQSGYLKLISGIFIFSIGITYLLGKDLHISCRFIHRYLVGKSNLSMFILGLLIGFSPCAPLMAILTYIASMAKNGFYGLVSGFSFGLGTFISPLLPAGIGAGLFSQYVKKSPKAFLVIRVISALILIYFGIRLILFSTTLLFQDRVQDVL